MVQSPDEPRPDTSDMLGIHRVFRGQLQLAPELITSVAAGDLGHAGRIAAHYLFLLEVLHHHHDGEDRLLWPKLEKRAPRQVQLIERMEAQHKEVARLVPQVDGQLRVWSAGADPAEASQLSRLIAELALVLEVHLAEEEEFILPLAEAHLSVDEWAQLGQEGLAAVPPERLPVAIGLLLHYTPDFWLPPPMAALWASGGEARFRSYMDGLRAA